MIQKCPRMFVLLLFICLVGLLIGCSGKPSNSQFIVRVSGDAQDLEFDGQCTAQKAEVFADDSAQSLDVSGTAEGANQPQDFETTGYFIYCAVANQSSTGTITVELLQDGNLVASAESTAPDEPAILEYGQTP